MTGPAEKKHLIADRLKRARKLAGLSQGQAAKKMSMHRPTISEIEAGNRNVMAPELAQFAELYDVDLAWLSGVGEDRLDPADERLHLAFRELKKIKPGDLDKLMRALAALRGPKEEE
ncbi:MAG TPA: helix-turn-helix transcriptional regulator [Gemmataceae bacterium]|jgi:transcriptional regulator with XRE-family HTH domain|nr:helix-turn-helix transcriptional regulator [Gemmataceae bacterium]